MRKIIHFLATYKRLDAVIVAIIAGLAFQLTGHTVITHWILGVTAVLNLLPLLWGMVDDIRHGQYGVDILAATAIIASVLLGEYWAGIVIVLMLTGGEALEDYAERRAKTELDALLSHAPKKALVIRGKKQLSILASEVRVNDKLLVKPGELIPVDAIIIEGNTSVDESSLTGEDLPIEKHPNDELLSGSLNLDGAITVKALRAAADSQYEQIVKLVKTAASNQSPFVRLADRYSIPFTITAYIIAISVWVASGDPMRFLEVIVVATPCPLLLGAPIALISGMSRAAKHGIIIKTGSSLEKMAAVQTIAFDKTGTLTMGQPVVGAVTTYNGFTKNQVLQIAASIEQNSNHILAQAVVDKAEELKLKLTKARQLRDRPGFGLEATVNHQLVLVGKAKLLIDAGISLPANLRTLSATTALVAIDGQLAGAISFTDELRSEAKTTLAKLKALGIKHILMITGDNAATAKSIAKKIGVTDVEADCLPADKLHAIERVSHKPVAFVGDGVNDAPVLTAADVGIALGARGSAAAAESADAVIMLDDLSRVASAISIAKRTFFIAKQSILIGIFISIGLMLIFATGRFKPIYGAALQEVVDVAVIFNALRAHGSWKKRPS